MGMFDTIHFTCPKCFNKITVQSKAGKCILADIDAMQTPVEIAARLVGTDIGCSECEEIWVIKAPLLTKRTPLELGREGDGPNDGYDDVQ